MSDILRQIVATKREEVAQARAARPLADVRADAESRLLTRDFAAALQAKELADQAGKLGEALAKGTDIAQAADISVSVSLGSSRSQSNSNQSSDSARGSSVTAGGDVNITARGAGKESDITIQGSTVKAGDTTRLSAEDEVRLLAAQNTQTETNSQSSKSGSVGLTFATSGISATASRASGRCSCDGGYARSACGCPCAGSGSGGATRYTSGGHNSTRNAMS